MEGTEYERPDSQQLLRRLQYEEKEEQKKAGGRLKIFLGYAAGSGKTYAMLTAAWEAAGHGTDVVAGYIEPHARPDTQALTKGLEVISPMLLEYKGVMLREFNLDAALLRKPELILVDELAHTNAAGCRNAKRYQDVRELLWAGINVYTTVNIQHLESLNDLVESITGIEVRERIPDSVFDGADQVEVIDIEPEELIERMKAGKIYSPLQAERALQNFFRREKLVALREIALRRTADRVNRIAEEERRVLGNTEYHTGEHVLVGISAAPSSAKVIRTASRLAYAFHAQFTGLYVETPELEEADEKTRAALQGNLEMARSLGARIVTVYGSEVVAQIAEYAIASNVSKVVIGRTNHITFWRGARKELLTKLTSMAPNIDVYIIPDTKQTKRYHKKRTGRREETDIRQTGIELAVVTAVIIGATAVAGIFKGLHVSESNIILVYLPAVLLSSYLVNQKSYALYSSLLSVLAFNFFFTEPLFSLKAYDGGFYTTFAMLFLAGLFTAGMTGKLKHQNREIARNAFRTEILLENSRKLRRCRSQKEVWEAVAGQAGKLIQLPVIVYPVSEKGIAASPMLFAGSEAERQELERCINQKEKAVVQWVVANHHRAGACTHTLPDAAAMYLPVQDAEEVKGVLGILLKERRPLRELEYELLAAMLNETGVKLQEV